MTATLRLGTRASPLARVQTDLVAGAIRQHHPDIPIEIVPLASAGELRPDASLTDSGEIGLFTTTIQQALLRSEVDVAVHSLKDLPLQEPPGLIIAAIPSRADSGDALVARDGLTLADLTPGASVGTSSVRRASQLSALRPDLRALPIRGNVQTRLAKLDAGDFDAIILAAAGLVRLGLESRITDRLQPPHFLPAPGQGALAVEIRTDDSTTAASIAPIDDPSTRAAVTAERQFLAAAGGGCNEPLGALATVHDGVLTLTAGRYHDPPVTQTFTGPVDDPTTLGNQAARALLIDQLHD
jgi:hydroxymethylbilane synthase